MGQLPPGPGEWSSSWYRVRVSRVRGEGMDRARVSRGTGEGQYGEGMDQVRVWTR